MNVNDEENVIRLGVEAWIGVAVGASEPALVYCVTNVSRTTEQ